MIQADLNIVLPEILLSVYAMLALVLAVYTGKDRLAGLLTWATAAVLVLVATWIGIGGSGAHVAFGGMFNDDAFARFAKVVILLGGAAVLVMSHPAFAVVLTAMAPGPHDMRPNAKSAIKNKRIKANLQPILRHLKYLHPRPRPCCKR